MPHQDTHLQMNDCNGNDEEFNLIQMNHIFYETMSNRYET